MASRKRRARFKANSGAHLAFHRILVPIDFSAESTRALKVAANLERGEGVDLLLVHVVGPIYDLRDFGYGPVQRCRPNEGLMRHARQRLQALGRRHVGQKQEWRCVVRSGTAPRQILKAVEEFPREFGGYANAWPFARAPSRRGKHCGASSDACGLSGARAAKTNTPKTTQELVKSNL